MSLDLNIEDQNHDDQLSSPNNSSNSFSSLSSSSSYPILLNRPDQVQQPSYYFQTNHLPIDHQDVEKINMVSSGSWDNNSTDQKQPLSPLGSSSTNNYSNQIRVCSDCNTTKTPLWRSGPRGPKSLCNACGIRQRKARRALALAAASANGTTVTADQTSSVKRKKLQTKKENKSKIDCSTSTHLKKKTKFESEPSQISKKELITFEDLRLSLSKNLSVQQVFPQDEREEAAILLMALSYGLVHAYVCSVLEEAGAIELVKKIGRKDEKGPQISCIVVTHGWWEGSAS
ncbi:hypothetical protein TSUD_205730 [Trifolium subterraneum]|uniref:GATA-type domain-containing protein n=1 Tax=Trifolium subterraneum TaxID=3900 RepID=A0A2Z6NT82_TRISU|nr:hypothetical protein TSUD_205730 [Trifolium subterraneum]